jgi:2-polyprenyl-3-methyl-5-hydroxy-6-metoxy-1,4-benzoquinol methylase
MKKPCPYCKTESDFAFRSWDYNRKITNVKFDHYRCPDCGLIFIDPVPANLSEYYPNEYYLIPETKDDLAKSSPQEQFKIDIIQRFVTQGRLLEIGPAFGSFAYAAQQRGFEVEAIEMDARCSQFLNSVLNIPTVNSDDTVTAVAALKNFDVIIIWHAIEHLPNPWKTLEALSQKLNKGGILILAAPNPDAFQFKLLGRIWWHLDAPRHLMLIPMKVLADTMQNQGMKVELSTTLDEGSIGHNLLGWFHSLANLFSQPTVNHWLKMLAHKATQWARPWEEKEGKGSTYTMVFRKV